MNIQKPRFSFQFLYYTNCINLSIALSRSVWRKKIRSSKRILILNTQALGENRNTLISQKRVQRYNKFLIWPNIFAKKLHKKCIFFVTHWFSILFIFAIFRAFGVILAQNMEFGVFKARTRYAYNIIYNERVYARAWKKNGKKNERMLAYVKKKL